MRHLLNTLFFLVISVGCALAGPTNSLPPDVRSGYWAAKSVLQATHNGLMTVQADGKFHGDAKVTRTEVVIALAKLGHILEQGQWKDTAISRPVPESVATLFGTTDWKRQPLRRYTLAAVLSRLADYVTNGVPRAKPGAKLGKSEVLETAKVGIPTSHPAYSALAYLAQNRMVRPGSVLLKPDNTPITGGEMSAALSAFAIGLNDRLTDLGKNPDSAPPDDATAKSKPN